MRRYMAVRPGQRNERAPTSPAWGSAQFAHVQRRQPLGVDRSGAGCRAARRAWRARRTARARRPRQASRDGPASCSGWAAARRQSPVVDQHVRAPSGRSCRSSAAAPRRADRGPACPVRRIGAEREDAGVDQRIADQPLGRRLVEAGLVGRAVDRARTRPRHGGSGASSDGSPAPPPARRARARGEEQRDRVALLHPAIAVDPEIEVEARESSAAGRAAPSAPCSRP